MFQSLVHLASKSYHYVKKRAKIFLSPKHSRSASFCMLLKAEAPVYLHSTCLYTQQVRVLSTGIKASHKRYRTHLSSNLTFKPVGGWDMQWRLYLPHTLNQYGLVWGQIWGNARDCTYFSILFTFMFLLLSLGTLWHSWGLKLQKSILSVY